MFGWNVNYGKFQNLWLRDKFSFTLSLALGSLLPCLQNTNVLSKAHETEARWQCCLVPAAAGPPSHASLGSSILWPRSPFPKPTLTQVSKVS